VSIIYIPIPTDRLILGEGEDYDRLTYDDIAGRFHLEGSMFGTPKNVVVSVHDMQRHAYGPEYCGAPMARYLLQAVGITEKRVIGSRPSAQDKVLLLCPTK